MRKKGIRMLRTPVFIRRLEEKKVLVLTIIDDEFVKDFPEHDSFILAHTERSIFTRYKITITLDGEKMDSKKYAKEISDIVGFEIKDTIGQSIGGIATGLYWFINKTKSIMEQIKGE